MLGKASYRFVVQLPSTLNRPLIMPSWTSPLWYPRLISWISSCAQGSFGHLEGKGGNTSGPENSAFEVSKVVLEEVGRSFGELEDLYASLKGLVRSACKATQLGAHTMMICIIGMPTSDSLDFFDVAFAAFPLSVPLCCDSCLLDQGRPENHMSHSMVIAFRKGAQDRTSCKVSHPATTAIIIS